MFRFNRRLSFLFRPSSRDRLVHYVTLGYALSFRLFWRRETGGSEGTSDPLVSVVVPPSRTPGGVVTCLSTNKLFYDWSPKEMMADDFDLVRAFGPDRWTKEKFFFFFFFNALLECSSRANRPTANRKRRPPP